MGDARGGIEVECSNGTRDEVANGATIDICEGGVMAVSDAAGKVLALYAHGTWNKVRVVSAG